MSDEKKSDEFPLIFLERFTVRIRISNDYIKGHSIANPNNALFYGKSLQITHTCALFDTTKMVISGPLSISIGERFLSKKITTHP